MECSQERESVGGDRGMGRGHDKKVVNWPAHEKIKREKNALKRRKIRARNRRKAYEEFLHTAFHGNKEIT